MLELTELLQPARERIEEIGVADLVIGTLSPGPPDEFAAALNGIRESVAKLYMPVRSVVVHAGDQPFAPQDDIRIIPLPRLMQDPSVDPANAISEACDAVFAIGDSLNARAVVIIVSGLESVSAQWIYRLTRPVLELEFDLVTPCYSHARFEGLLNTGIVSPLTRALYGRQIQHPLGPDFAFSGKLAKRLLEKTANARTTVHMRSLASLAADAVSDGFEICQAHLGPRRYRPTDWMNQSSVLSQILGPVFSEADLHAPFWQRIRGSQPVPVFGEAPGATSEDEPIDIRRMIESFQLGHRNLQEIWGTVLPPGTLLDLTKIARLPLEQFRVPDRLWARIIYDFAVGHHLRLINQDHLLRAMTPLYLAWVASYVLELGTADENFIDHRRDQLALAFEAAKPYVLSRWRWPDRFNP